VAVRHCARNVEVARADAFHHGVPGGRSLELARAEAALEVNTWRLGRWAIEIQGSSKERGHKIANT